LLINAALIVGHPDRGPDPLTALKTPG